MTTVANTHTHLQEGVGAGVELLVGVVAHLQVVVVEVVVVDHQKVEEEVEGEGELRPQGEVVGVEGEEERDLMVQLISIHQPLPSILQLKCITVHSQCCSQGMQNTNLVSQLTWLSPLGSQSQYSAVPAAPQALWDTP